MAVGDTYVSSQQFRQSFARTMASEGRAGRLDTRVSGGRYKMVRCTGAIINHKTEDKVARALTGGCQARARACRQATNEWKVTEVHFGHENCTGQAPPAAGSAPKKQRICRRSIEPEAVELIRANSRISAGALSKTLKATKGLDIPERTANRMINEERGRSKAALDEDYQKLESYLEVLGRGNGNVVECKVSSAFQGVCNKDHVHGQPSGTNREHAFGLALFENVFPPSGFSTFGPSYRHRRCSIVEVRRDRSALCRSPPCSSLTKDPFRLPCANGCRSLREWVQISFVSDSDLFFWFFFRENSPYGQHRAMLVFLFLR